MTKEQLLDTADKLARTLSDGVKTRDVGECERCHRRATTSGMNPYCARCVPAVALAVRDGIADLIAGRTVR